MRTRSNHPAAVLVATGCAGSGIARWSSSLPFDTAAP